MTNKFLILTLALLISTLLIGQRFGFTWAGGNGVIEDVEIRIVAEGEFEVDRNGEMETVSNLSPYFPERGEIIKTGDNSLEILVSFPTVDNESVHSAHIFLDANTDLKLESIKTIDFEAHLIRGRLLIDHYSPTDSSTPLVIKTRSTTTIVKDALMSMVNYDFLEKVAIIPIESQVEIITQEDSFVTDTAWEINELDTSQITPIEFDPLNSSAKDFYVENWPGKGRGESLRSEIDVMENIKTLTF